jgi:CheY-like chemotaxis protein
MFVARCVSRCLTLGKRAMTQILLVEDEQLTRACIRDLLEDAGYSVAEAGDGRQGLEACDAAHYDLVITDMLMPRADGVELIQALKNGHADMPILAISGGGRVPGALCLTLAGSLGAVATLAKPFSRDALLAAVSTCLDGSPGGEPRNFLV